MFCSKCGTENSDSARFCKNCGDSIGSSGQNVYSNNFKSTAGKNSKNPVDFYLMGFSKYATFSGRSQRAEFWWFYLPNAIIPIGLQTIGIISQDNSFLMMVYVACIIYSLITIIPTLAVSVRRLHDIGMSGAMVWITLIPIIGLIWILVLMSKDSDLGINQYGPNPKRMMAN